MKEIKHASLDPAREMIALSLLTGKGEQIILMLFSPYAGFGAFEEFVAAFLVEKPVSEPGQGTGVGFFQGVQLCDLENGLVFRESEMQARKIGLIQILYSFNFSLISFLLSHCVLFPCSLDSLSA